MHHLRAIFLLSCAGLLLSCGKSTAPSDSANTPQTNPASADSPDVSSGSPGGANSAGALASPANAPAPGPAVARNPRAPSIQSTPAAPALAASPEKTWHGKTDAENPLFAYLYAENAHAGAVHIRVLAASLLQPGPHQIDVNYRRDPHGPEENIQLDDFAKLSNVDGIRWTLLMDGSVEAHGKYPLKTSPTENIIDAPSATVHPEEEAAILAESFEPQALTMAAAANSPEHLILWLRIQSAPGWHGDAPLAPDPKISAADGSNGRSPEAAVRLLNALEIAAQHRSAIGLGMAVTDAGNMDIKQAAPLLEILWTDPAQQANALLRREILAAAAQLGQPLDILRQVAADPSNAANQTQAIVGLARLGDADAQKMLLDRAQAELKAGSRDFGSDSLAMEKFVDSDFRDAIGSLSSLATDNNHTNQLGNLLAAIDANLKSSDELIALAVANSLSDPRKNIVIFHALGERANLDDILAIEQIPPLDQSSQAPADQLSYRAKTEAILRIRQRFWRESDRAPAILAAPNRAPTPPRDDSLP